MKFVRDAWGINQQIQAANSKWREVGGLNESEIQLAVLTVREGGGAWDNYYVRYVLGVPAAGNDKEASPGDVLARAYQLFKKSKLRFTVNL